MAIKTIRKMIDWCKYERLDDYPALRDFDPPEALKRLNAYEREEREACQPWLRITWIVMAVLFVVSAIGGYFNIWVCAFMLFLQIPSVVLQYMMYHRIRRRVEAKVAAELRDGRLWTCVECGYDLRASEGPTCPECGASIRVPPIKKSVPDAGLRKVP